MIRKPAPLNWAGPPRHWHIRGSESAAAGDHLRLSASGSLGPIGGPSPPRPAAASESRRGRNPGLGPPIYTEGNHTRRPPCQWLEPTEVTGRSAPGLGRAAAGAHFGHGGWCARPQCALRQSRSQLTPAGLKLARCTGNPGLHRVDFVHKEEGCCLGGLGSLSPLPVQHRER